jgi:hypothetical protein
MKVQEVLRVVDEIVPLLASHGHPDKATWLGKDSALLRNSRLSDSQAREALKRLHRIVPGMGGLMDLPLTGSSPEEEAVARETLDKLGDELYELTR